jgi:hypothetical protein
LNFSLSFIDESGLANVTSPNDWLRFGMGGHNIEANSILYYTINQAITLASALNDTSLIPTWQSTALTIKSTANTLLWNDTTGLYHDNETTLLSPQDGNVWAIISNLTDSPSKITSISAALAERWTPYGAPAPEASSAISPFISGFELQAHLLAANATRALNLMRLEWGFMLDDPRMTNSTFIEGYADNGNLHYAPYTNDARVSFAHGWATGPTSTLTFLVAGVQLTSAGGKTWRIEPALGDLTKVEAGFSTSLGWFESKTIVREDGKGVNMSFETPEETMGVVAGSFLGCNGKAILSGKQERSVDVGEGRVEIKDVKGGKYTLSFSCS